MPATEPNVYELTGPTPDGPRSIKVIDLGQQPVAIPVEQAQGQPWPKPDPQTGFGQAYDPADEEPPRLNLDRTDMERFIDGERTRINVAHRTLEQALQRVASTYGRIDDAATWEAVRTNDPDLLTAVADAERRANGVVNTVKLNALAVERETQATAMTLSERDEQKAAVRLPLIERSVDRDRLDDVRDAFRFAIVSDDTVSMYLYAKLLPDRLRRAPEQRDDGDGARTVRESPAVKAELASMIDTVRKKKLADDSLSDLRTKAYALRDGAATVASLARTRKNAIAQGKAGLVRRDGF